MIIDGRVLSEKIKESIRKDVQELTDKGISPKIVIVTVGPEGTWRTCKIY